MQKLRVYHFNNGTGGGVFSAIRYLLAYSLDERIENHIIYTINKDVMPNYEVTHIEGAITEQIFYYSPHWNFYYTCRELSKLLPDDNAVIIANDWIELGMVSNLGLQNKVIQILHGDYDYYYNLAKLHTDAVDVYLTVSASIKGKLQSILPKREKDIEYMRFPVPGSNCVASTDRNENSIVFIGRCTYEKGYHLLPGIAKSLVSQKVDLHWHIIGEINDTEKYPWDASVKVTFHGLISNDDVNKLLCQMQVFILPSIAEGMPMSLVESMKAGVVPLVNDLPGGIQELVIQQQTGIKIPGNDPGAFAEALMKIARNAAERQYMAVNARQRANEMFDPINNTIAIENLYVELYNRFPRKKIAVRVYGSRLDYPWIVNWITSSLRRRLKKKDM